jgi:hypothetical protein
MTTYFIKVNDPTRVKRVGDRITFSSTYDQFNKFHIKEIIWRFGDGGTSTKMNPTHRYTTSGNKQIVCQINRMYTIRKTLRVEDRVVAPSTPTPPSEEVGAFRVINNSNTVDALPILIFQRNVATRFDETEVAWRYTNISSGGTYRFDFPGRLTVSFNDTFGNFTSVLSAELGDKFTLSSTISGTEIMPRGSSSSPQTIELENETNDNFTANVFRSGKLLARKTNLRLGDAGLFSFQQNFWIGVAPGLIEGQTIDSPVISSINTQISLLGVASADIVVTGGGAGPSATPYTFNLANIVYA